MSIVAAGWPTTVHTASDDFEVDGPLAAPWIDGHTIKPDRFEPLGARAGAAVIWTDRTRPGTYQLDQSKSPPVPPGALYSAVGCAYQDTGSVLPDVTIDWTGNWHIPVPLALNSHVEATPLVYIDLDNPLGGAGFWPGHFGGDTAAWLFGYIGSPPELFRVDGLGTPTSSVEGQACQIRVVAVSPGRIILIKDGVQQPIVTTRGPARAPLDPIPVDPSLTSSTLHGFALDGHLVYPTGNATITPGITGIELHA